jgi:phage protein D
MASTVISLSDVRQPFYVPAFEIEVNGSPLPRGVARDVMEVTYEDSVDKVDSFTLLFNNWDADGRHPKFVGDRASTADWNSVQPGNTVRLSLGYQGSRPDFRVMTTGIITSLEADFPEAGTPRLTVRGLNVLDRFRQKQYTWSWPPDGKEGIRDSEIAEDLSGAPDNPAGKPGLGVPVKIDDGARDLEQPRPHVYMNNLYPIVFLMGLARRNAYDLFITPDDPAKPIGDENLALWFGPSRRVSDRTYLLEWGKNLTALRASVSTARQVKKVTVLGWDRVKKQPIKGEATVDSDGVNLSPTVRTLAAANGREEVVTDYVVVDEQAAKAKAVELLNGITSRLIEITATVIGLPDLRAGRVVRLERVGPQLQGNYFVTETRHTVSDAGYRTVFKARLEGSQQGM